MYRLLSLILLVICPSLLLVPVADAQERRPERMGRSLESADLETPRATVKTFFEAMRGYKAGNAARLVDATQCLYLGEELTPEERVNAGSQPAHTLFAAMDGIQFDMDSIETGATARNLNVNLGEGEDQFTLYLRQYDDGLWRISSQSLEPDYLASLETIVARRDEAVKAAESEFLHALRSPRVTMEAFIKGMNGEDGFTQADAINTLDLSDVTEVDRESVGGSAAADLKALIDRIKLVEFAEIPPESDRETYVFFQDPAGIGSIVLAPVPDDKESELKAWRFTKGTLDSLEDLYLHYKDRPLVRGLAVKSDAKPLANRIRDWTGTSYPALLEAPVYLRNYQWLGLLILVFLGVFISRILTLITGVFIRYWFRRKGYEYDTRLERDFIRPIRIALMAWVWLYGLTLLGLNPDALKLLRIAAFFVTLVGAIWAAYCLVDIIGKYMTERALQSASKHDDLLVPIVVRTLKISIVVVGLVALAFQLNENPASLLTGLGLGGLAFALAAKDVVANEFGSVTILSDRPFRIGDWVTVGSIDGSVESVGIRSTRIRTFYNSLITVPNSELTNAHIDNMGARRYRRVKTNLGVTYDTPPESIEAFCEGIRELIRSHPYTRKDYYHVYLNGFSESSLDILLYCFVETPDWGTELREKHRLYLDIIRLAKSLDISFAFPTQTLFLNQETPEESAESTASPGLRRGVAAARELVAPLRAEGLECPPPVTFRGPEDLSSRTMKEQDHE